MVICRVGIKRELPPRQLALPYSIVSLYQANETEGGGGGCRNGKVIKFAVWFFKSAVFFTLLLTLRLTFSIENASK
jgi:hypothetical protein